ncbi:MAG TPA: glycerophosphodiester phosphodiesterase family protein [Thermomicrobiales bacterium]|nr:glycerophosphodiester phosphodiesterase family protein [Thermomicrobiales bacterium]
MLTIAHRGASGYAPENTRAAFERAIEMGADMIETDVQLTLDGELVLIHDDLVDRTTDGQGPVADHTLAEIQALDAGSWLDPAYAGQRILTLAEFATEFLPRIPACLEIKDPLATAPLLDAVARLGIGDRVHITSFSWSALLPATMLHADLVYGYLSRTFNDDIIRRCVARGIVQICPPADLLTPELVAAAHEAGLVVRAWGVRDHAHVDRLFATGADGATVNWPDWIPARPASPSRAS